MIRSEYPKLTPAQVGQALSTSARRPNRKRRYDTDLGFGYLNAIGALTQARALAGKNTPTITAPSSVPEKTSLAGDVASPVGGVLPVPAAGLVGGCRGHEGECDGVAAEGPDLVVRADGGQCDAWSRDEHGAGA